MKLLEGILTRRSVRKYTDQKIPKEDLQELIKFAQYAPSAHNTRPWEFIIIEDKEKLSKFKSFQRLAAFAENAAAVILVCIDKDKSFSRPKENWSYEDIDGSSATMNIIYAAHAKGLGACWCGCSPMTSPIESIKNYYNLPENIKPFSIITLGYPASVPNQPEDREDKTKIHWENW